MKSDASHIEVELLRRLHRDAWAQLAALRELSERTPEDELRLRASMRTERRLMDRIEMMTVHDDPQRRAKPLRDASPEPDDPAIAAE